MNSSDSEAVSLGTNSNPSRDFGFAVDLNLPTIQDFDWDFNEHPEERWGAGVEYYFQKN